MSGNSSEEIPYIDEAYKAGSITSGAYIEANLQTSEERRAGMPVLARVMYYVGERIVLRYVISQTIRWCKVWLMPRAIRLSWGGTNQRGLGNCDVIRQIGLIYGSTTK